MELFETLAVPNAMFVHSLSSGTLGMRYGLLSIVDSQSPENKS